MHAHTGTRAHADTRTYGELVLEIGDGDIDRLQFLRLLFAVPAHATSHCVSATHATKKGKIS